MITCTTPTSLPPVPTLLDAQHKERPKPTWWERVKDILLGPEVAEGAWRPLKRPDSRFVHRYGTLFEENRGPPMVMRGASFQADPVTGLCNRGKLQPHLGRPLLSLGGRKWYRHHLQAFGSSVEILKVVAYAVVLNSPSSSRSWAQVRYFPQPALELLVQDE